MTKNKALYRYIAVLLIFSVGILTQTNILLNFDVSWLMRATEKMLNGGHYYTDFLETNPPLILYLYMPPVLIAKLLHIKFAISFKSYIFAIALTSISLCYFLLKKVLIKDEKFILYWLVLIITFAFTIMPAFSFGEREHIMIMLVLPYFFLLYLRLSNKPINLSLICLIGIMAGIGFAIKPYFLCAPLLTEIYFIYKKHNLFACFRTETIIIFLFIISYFISIFIFTPNYIHKILPLVFHLYFSSEATPLTWLIPQNIIIFWLITAGFYAFFYEKINDRLLINILFLTSIGFLYSYFAQHTTWYYHALPALTITSIIIVLLTCKLITIIQTQQPRWIDFLLLACLQATIVFFPIGITYSKLMLGFNITKKTNSSSLYNYVKQHAQNKPVYVFTTRIIVVSTLTDYAKALPASRAPSCVFLPGLIKLTNSPNLTKKEKQKIKKEKKELINIVIQDIQKNKPALILVDNIKHNLYPNKHFDYIKFFSQDKRFKKLFKQYKYIKTLHHFAIYARN